MILGIDPGTATTGFALVKGTQKNPEIVEYGTFQTAPRDKKLDPQRLKEIADDIEYLIENFKPTKAVVEDLFFFKNAKTVITVAQARGVILYLLEKNNIPVVSVTPLQIKQTLCGYGRAEKKQVQAMVKKIYNLEEIPKPDDAADALGMAWYGLPH